MSGSRHRHELRLRIYRLLLIALPGRFRDAWGEDMVAALAAKLERVRRLGGAAAAWRLFFVALADLLISAALERLPAFLRRASAVSRSPRPSPRSEGSLMTRLVSTLRYAIGTLVRQPTLAALVCVTLSVGAGGTIAFFAVVDAAVLNPLPYPEPHRLVSLAQTSERFGRYGWAAPFLPDLRARTSSYDALSAFSPSWSLTMTEPGEPQVVPVVFVDKGLLELFGARIIAGRLPAESEFALGAPPTMIATQAFWERHFDAGRFQSGRTLTVNGTTFEILGVVSDATRMPIRGSAASAGAARVGLFAPVAHNEFLMARGRPIMNVVARLADGATIEAARAELEAVNAGLGEEAPDLAMGAPIDVSLLAERAAAGSRTLVWVLFGAAALLLLIACANVANLLLARAASRTDEMSIRAALGASRGRLLEQLLTESAILAVIACLGGLVLAALLLRLLPAAGLLELPQSAVVQIGGRTAAFALALSAATTLLFGLAPAIHLARGSSSMSPGSGTRLAAGPARRLRGALVAAEVALALVLLVGAGLLSRSFLRLSAVDPGFEADGVLSVPIALGSTRWPTSGERRTFYEPLIEQIAAIPGVELAGAVNRLPLAGGNVFVAIEIERGNATDEPLVTVDRRVVTPNYFATLRVPVLEGRDFSIEDAADVEEGVAIVNRAAQRLFVEQEVLGQRLRLQLRNGFGPWLRVVGVIDDIRHHGLHAAAEPEVYVPYAQASVQNMTVVARVAGDPRPIIGTIKQRVWERDREIPLDAILPVARVIATSVTDPRSRMMLMQSFAAMALGLAGLGIAGVVSYTVARRGRDYGIRLALGARSSEVVRLALREGLVPGAIGAVTGIFVAALAARILSSMLYATSPADPVTFAAVSTALLGIVAIASWVPARRATRVDPVAVLRSE